MAEITVKKGNYGFDFEFTIKNPDGSAKDLTGLDITLKVWKAGESICKFTGTCTVTDAANGRCKYTVKSTDFDKIEGYKGELELTTEGLILDTKSFSISVVETAP